MIVYDMPFKDFVDLFLSTCHRIPLYEDFHYTLRSFIRIFSVNVIEEDWHSTVYLGRLEYIC